MIAATLHKVEHPQGLDADAVETNQEHNVSNSSSLSGGTIKCFSCFSITYHKNKTEPTETAITRVKYLSVLPTKQMNSMIYSWHFIKGNI
jgi:hypothetical protein